MKNLRIMAVWGRLNLVFPALLLAQADLGNPPDGSTQNGPISFSGFTCSGTTVEIDVDGTVFTAGYPTTRGRRRHGYSTRRFRMRTSIEYYNVS